jgi:hypothetical protein
MVRDSTLESSPRTRSGVLAYAPDGTALASGSEDGTVRIWDVATGTPPVILTGHTAPITSLTYAPNGTTLSTSAADGLARVWDGRTGRPLLTVPMNPPPAEGRPQLRIAEVAVEGGGLRRYGTAVAIGSGAVLTAAHVTDLGAGSPRYLVRFAEAAPWKEARLVYRDVTVDLAMLTTATAEPDSQSAGRDVDPAELLFPLATALRARWELTGQHADLDRATDLLEAALAATPPGSPDQPAVLSNLATALRARWELTGQHADLDRATDLLEAALAATPPGSPTREAVESRLRAVRLARVTPPRADDE